MRTWFGSIVLLFSLVRCAAAQDTVYSGPQVGEKVASFRARGVFGDLAGQEFDLVGQSGGKPLVVIFVHEMTRPSIAVTRTLMDYAAKQAPQGLACGVVFLDGDLTEAESRLKRAGHALPTQVPIGISLDGREGPGAYGLNRNVALTVLVAKNNVVTANFALVQPSLLADVQRMATPIAEVLGTRPPTLAELGIRREGMPAANRGSAAGGKVSSARGGELETKLRAFIQKDNHEAIVREIAAAIEKLVAEDASARARLGEITSTIVQSGKLENYGTPAAQTQIRAWAAKYGMPGASNRSGASPK